MNSPSEEVLYSARLWTSGYNFYAPREAYLTHHYGRDKKPKFWTDISATSACQRKAKMRLLYFFGVLPLDRVPEPFRRDISRFGMGSARSLESYLRFAKIDFQKKRVGSSC